MIKPKFNTRLLAKVVIAILVLSAIIFFYYKYMLSPKVIVLRDINDQVQQADAKVSELLEVKRVHNRLDAQNTAYATWIDKLLVITPSVFQQKDNLHLMLDIQSLGKDSGIQLGSVTIADSSIGKDKSQIVHPTELKVAKAICVTINYSSTNYATCCSFSDLLRTKFQYIMIPETMTMSMSTSTLNGEKSSYVCTVTAWATLSPDAAVQGVALAKKSTKTTDTTSDTTYVPGG